MVKFEKKKPTEEELQQLGFEQWDMWTKEVSDFDWEYDERETFYVLEGKAEIESGDEKISFARAREFRRSGHMLSGHEMRVACYETNK